MHMNCGIKPRKIPAVLLSVVMALALSACGAGYPEDDAYHFDSDSQFSFYMSDNACNIAASENGYYFLNYDYLYYMDGETMEPVPLCAKPQCRHGGPSGHDTNPTCDACYMLVAGTTRLFYADGHLYVFSSFTDDSGNRYSGGLMRMNPDGTERTILFSLQDEVSWESVPDGCAMALHRGWLYFTENVYDTEGTVTINVWRHSVDHPEKKSELLYTEDEPASELWQAHEIDVHGESLFLKIAYQNGVKWVRMATDGSGAQTLEPFEEGVLPLDIAFVGDSVYCVVNIPDEKANCRIVKYSDDFSSYEETDFDVPGCWITGDGEYLYAYEVDMAAAELAKTLYIYNEDGTLADSVLVPGEALEQFDITTGFVNVSPTDKVFIEDYFANVALWFDKSEIGTGNIQLHWLFGGDAQ